MDETYKELGGEMLNKLIESVEEAGEIRREDKLKQLVKATNKRIGQLSEVEFEYSMRDIIDYPLHFKELLSAIHERDEGKLGRAMMMYLYVYNQDDIEINGE